MEVKNEWVLRVNEEAQQVMLTDTDDTIRRLKKCSIYRLPAAVVNLNEKAYFPQWVSLGPYHHGKEHLLPMEEHKQRALLYTLKRSNQNLEIYVRVVEEVVDDLLSSYQSIDPFWQYNTNDFVKLMILDGCFMLEILRKSVTIRSDYPPSDPVFGEHGTLHVLPYIRLDMIMLENQLPILLLEKLAAVEKIDVHRLIFKFLFNEIPNQVVDGCLHMLHLYIWGLFWLSNSRRTYPKSECVGYVRTATKYVESATKLSQAGITFRVTRTSNLKDISFSNGVLRLPSLVIDETTETLFLNLLAFERFHVGAGSKVTSYIHLMVNIIQNVEDISLLSRQGIIQSELGNDTTTIKFFNTISKAVVFDPDDDQYNNMVSDKIFKYCNSGWPRFRSSLIDTYIREWPVLSAAAAALIFILTITQTVYTIYPAYHK